MSSRPSAAPALPASAPEQAVAWETARLAEPGSASRHRRFGALWPLGLYTLLSLLLFGVPVLGHLGSRTVAANDLDPSSYMWFIAWWPYALAHGLNPIVTHMMFYPGGYNLAWSTAMPGPSIVLSPVTLAFGPVVSFNVLQLLSPALGAWTAFLLCRHLTGRTWPSLAGGYVFGFSPYVLAHLTGAPNLTLVALLPVLVLLVVRRVEGSIGARRFVVAMTLALTFQYLTSSELFTTATLFGVIALALALTIFAERRGALLDTVKLLIVAYGATLILISPFLYYFIFGHHYPPSAPRYLMTLPASAADVVSFVLPPPLVALARHTPPYAGANAEGYLSLPLIVLIGLFIWQQRRSRTAWLITLSLVIAAVCSLGGYLFVRGRLTSIPGPWLAFRHLPLLRYVLPDRFGVFVVLPAGLIVALWLRRGGVGRWGLVVLAIVLIVPDVGSSAWDSHVKDPPFFSSGAYRTYLNHDDHVLTVPVWGRSLRWIADAGFPFALTAGYGGQGFPRAYTRYPTWNTLLTGRLTPDYGAQLRRFVAAKDVTAIVVDQGFPGPWSKLFSTLGVRPVATGGVLLYRLRPARS